MNKLNLIILIVFLSGCVFKTKKLDVEKTTLSNSSRQPSIPQNDLRTPAAYNGVSLPMMQRMASSIVKIQTDMGKCTGTLIAPNAVLTAAHCLKLNNKTAESLRVSHFTVGVRSQEIVLLESLNSREVLSFIRIPEGYATVRDSVTIGDIAIIQLKQSAPMDLMSTTPLMVNPARLQSTVWVAGYGVSQMQIQGGVGRDLEDLNFISGLLISSPVQYLRNTSVIAIQHSSNQAFCTGDSGGPLFYVNPESGAIGILGVNTNSEGSTLPSGQIVCKQGGVTYSQSVPHFRSWIESNMSVRIDESPRFSQNQNAVARPRAQIVPHCDSINDQDFSEGSICNGRQLLRNDNLTFNRCTQGVPCGQFQLVKRNQYGFTLWKDLQSNILFTEASREDVLVNVLRNFCTSELSLQMRDGIAGNFILLDVESYIRLLRSGLTSFIPESEKTDHFIWLDGEIFSLDGSTDRYDYRRNNPPRAKVRCMLKH